MTARPDNAHALTETALRAHRSADLTGALAAVVESVQHSLPGVDHVGIAITHGDGRVETLAATDELVCDLDQLQYELGEGPCLSAIYEDPVVIVAEARQEHRWPRYVPRAIERGLRGQIGIRLFLEDKALGGLNLYSIRDGGIDPEVQHTAQLFATHAALVLGRVRHEEELNTALYTRKVIGQAIGILMERYDLDEDRAFQFLARVSQHSNTKLREVAVELVRTANEENAIPADGSALHR